MEKVEILKKHVFSHPLIPVRYEVVLDKETYKLGNEIKVIYHADIYRCIEDKCEKDSFYHYYANDLSSAEDRFRWYVKIAEEMFRREADHHLRGKIDTMWTEMNELLKKEKWNRPLGFINRDEVVNFVVQYLKATGKYDEYNSVLSAIGSSVEKMATSLADYHINNLISTIYETSVRGLPRTLDGFIVYQPSLKLTATAFMKSRIMLIHPSLIDKPLVGVKVMTTKKGTAWKILPNGDYAVILIIFDSSITNVIKGYPVIDDQIIKNNIKEAIGKTNKYGDILLASLWNPESRKGFMIWAVKMTGKPRAIAYVNVHVSRRPHIHEWLYLYTNKEASKNLYS